MGVTHAHAKEHTGHDAPPERVRAATRGAYEIVGLLGRGSLADVYLAADLRQRRKVALKVLREDFILPDGAAQRFTSDASRAAALYHPNIIVTYAAEERDGLLTLLTSPVRGASLDVILQNEPILSLPVIQSVLVGVAAALDYAHGLGVLHRDLKPSNVLLNLKGDAIVTDFAAMATLDEVRAATETGERRATFLSPEQVRDGTFLQSSDQYALGVLAYLMLTGMPPFAGTTAEVRLAHLKRPPVPLLQLQPELPAQLAGAVMRMLSKSPHDRFSSMRDAEAALSYGFSPHDQDPRAHLAWWARQCLPLSPESYGVNPNAHEMAVAESGSPAHGAERLRFVNVAATVCVNETVQLTAELVTAGGMCPPGLRFQWTSSDSTVAGVNPEGQLQAHLPGAVTLTVEHGGTSASTTLTVEPVRVATVRFAEPTSKLALGDDLRLEALVEDATGQRLTGRTVIWSSSAPAVAMVEPGGTVCALREGTAIIRASCSGHVATVAVIVEAAGAGAYRSATAPWTPTPADGVGAVALDDGPESSMEGPGSSERKRRVRLFATVGASAVAVAIFAWLQFGRPGGLSGVGGRPELPPLGPAVAEEATAARELPASLVDSRVEQPLRGRTPAAIPEKVLAANSRVPASAKPPRVSPKKAQGAAPAKAPAPLPARGTSTSLAKLSKPAVVASPGSGRTALAPRNPPATTTTVSPAPLPAEQPPAAQLPTAPPPAPSVAVEVPVPAPRLTDREAERLAQGLADLIRGTQAEGLAGAMVGSKTNQDFVAWLRKKPIDVSAGTPRVTSVVPQPDGQARVTFSTPISWTHASGARPVKPASFSIVVRGTGGSAKLSSWTLNAPFPP